MFLGVSGWHTRASPADLSTLAPAVRAFLPLALFYRNHVVDFDRGGRGPTLGRHEGGRGRKRGSAEHGGRQTNQREFMHDGISVMKEEFRRGRQVPKLYT